MRIGHAVLAAVVSVTMSLLLAGCTAGATPASSEKTDAASIRPSSSAEAPSDAAPAADSLAPGDHTLTIKIDGIKRMVLLHVPDAPGPLPLMLVYHRVQSTAQATRASTDFAAVGDERGIIVAFLQGYLESWNEGAGGTPAREAGVDDVAFTAAALREVSEKTPVDASRVAAVGFSNGALLTELLGCAMADSLSLVVPVEGPMPTAVGDACHPAAPVSILEIHGTADTAIPYGGGAFAGVGGGTTVLSAPDTVALWARLDGCAAQPTQSTKQSGTQVSRYTGCDGEARVELQTIPGGRHQWPGDIGAQVADALLHLPE